MVYLELSHAWFGLHLVSDVDSGATFRSLDKDANQSLPAMSRCCNSNHTFQEARSQFITSTVFSRLHVGTNQIKTFCFLR